MLLTIDIGNTLIDFGLWDNDELSFVYKTRTKPLRSLDEYRSVLELFVMTKHPSLALKPKSLGQD